MPIYRTHMTVAPGRLRRSPLDDGITFQVDFWALDRRQAERRARQYLCNRYVRAIGKMSTIRARKGTIRNTAGVEFARDPALDKGGFAGWRKL